MALKNLIKFSPHTDISALRKQLMRISMITGIVVFGLGVLAAYIFSFSLETRQQQEFDNYRNQTSQNINEYIGNKVSSYETLLVSASSHLKIKSPDQITRKDWNAIYEGLKVQKEMPEILGFGFSQYLKPNEIQQHTSEVRREIPNYSLSPSNSRAEYTSIKYIEPLNSLNRSALGFDMFTEPNRNLAMSTARDSGLATMTGPVVAVQDESSKSNQKPKSILIYYPFYSNGAIIDEVAQKRANLEGYVYVIIRAGDIIKQQEAAWQEKINSFELSDTTDGSGQNLYTTEFNKIAGDIYTENTQDFEVAGRTWQSKIELKNQAQNTPFTPDRVFIGGIIFSAIVGMLIFMLLSRRTGALREAHEEEIQRTKDELLALASHQLRTPATAVRQYVAMLTNGYFGDLKKDQISIAEKAFIANERQLEIIDQILYVAKADAGQLILAKEEFDLNKLTQRIIEEFEESISKKRITLDFKKNKKIIINADERYVSMVIENIISNAIKYSYPESNIKITTKIDKAGFAIVKIKDQGVGISKDDQSKLFQKFSRIENPLSRTEGGSGLGLFLANKLAIAHGGQILVNSTVGKGSAFIFKLPLDHKNYDKNVVQLTE